VWLSSNWFIGFTDLEMKNHEPNQTRSVSICSDRFQTEPNKVGYFSVWFGLNFRFRWFCPNHLHPESPEYSCLCICNVDDVKVIIIDRICTCSNLIFQPESNKHRTKTGNQNKTTKSQKQTKENRKYVKSLMHYDRRRGWQLRFEKETTRGRMFIDSLVCYDNCLLLFVICYGRGIFS